MNSLDRIKGTLAHDRSYDHYGVFEDFWPETLPRWVTQGYPEGVDPADYFEYDLQGVGATPDMTPFRDEGAEILEQTDEWIVTRSGWGAVLKNWKHRSGTPEHIDFGIKTPEDWLPYRERIADVTDPVRIDVEGMRTALAKGRTSGRFIVFAYASIVETLRASLGDVTMLESMLLEPDWIHDISRVVTDFMKRHYALLFDEVGIPDGIFVFEDIGYRSGLFASPKAMSELIFPYYAEMFDFFHGYGLPVIMHSCGGVTEAVPHLIDAGVDCLEPLEAKAGVDVISLAREYGDRMVFSGNVDVVILGTNDRAAIRKHVLELLTSLWDIDADFIFHSDHSIPPEVDFDTYRYVVDLFREFCATHSR